MDAKKCLFFRTHKPLNWNESKAINAHELCISIYVGFWWIWTYKRFEKIINNFGFIFSTVFLGTVFFFVPFVNVNCINGTIFKRKHKIKSLARCKHIWRRWRLYVLFSLSLTFVAETQLLLFMLWMGFATSLKCSLNCFRINFQWIHIGKEQRERKIATIGLQSDRMFLLQAIFYFVWHSAIEIWHDHGVFETHCSIHCICCKLNSDQYDGIVSVRKEYRGIKKNRGKSKWMRNFWLRQNQPILKENSK